MPTKRATINESMVGHLLNKAEIRESLSTIWSSVNLNEHDSSQSIKNAFGITFPAISIERRRLAYPDSPSEEHADYRLESRLGEGGMGIVFEARQTRLDRAVALKMIRPEKSHDPFFQKTFLYEAIITANMDHPAIIPVLEFGVSQDGQVFYTMKKATGVSWRKVIRQKSFQENLEIFERVADVVAYAHSMGIIHRDLKPDNVLLGKFGEVWLGDWGLAVREDGEKGFTHACPGGTPHYMSPEMALCDHTTLSHASDIYLLGGILLEIITGKAPHSGLTSLDSLVAASTNHLPDIASDNQLRTVVYRALSSRPLDRYTSVQEMQNVIRQCLQENKSAELLHKADEVLIDANNQGDYELYRQAISGYDAAVAASPASSRARASRHKAVIAYGREALRKGEFDLAASIIQPEIKAGPEAANLLAKITRERKAAKRHRRNYIVSAITISCFALGVIFLGSYAWYNRLGIVHNYYLGLNRTEVETFRKLVRDFDHFFGCVDNLRILTGAEYSDDSTDRMIRRRHEKYEATLPAVRQLIKVTNECKRTFDQKEWETKSQMRNITRYLDSRIPEMEELINEVSRLESDAKDKLMSETLRKAFATVVYDVNTIRQRERD